MPRAKIQKRVFTNQTVDHQAKMFEDIVAKTLQEMIVDVSHIDIQKSEHLANCIKDLSNHKIARHLQNATSDLCKAIPKDILDKDASGKKYLEILSMIQPTLKPNPIAVQPSVQEVLLQPAELQLRNTPVEGMPSGLEDVMKGVMDKDLLDLAESVRKDLNVNEEEVGKAFQEMNMDKIMDIYEKAASVIKSKLGSGQIDVERLKSQTMNFVDKMKDTKEFKDVLQENPSISMMMNAGMMSTMMNGGESMPSLD